MDYYEFNFSVDLKEDFHRDLLINAAAEAGFDTFEETTEGFNAYIAVASYDEARLEESLLPYHGVVNFSYGMRLVPQKNWNEVWESNFDPIIVKDQCYVRATFHQKRADIPYEIVIDPKMAFGTGHHQTTSMMMEFMLEEEIKGRSVLDMGCGTGILAILASKLGAATVTAIDYDEVCYHSTIENSQLNGSRNIEVLCGSKEAIPDRRFDLIFANINRNILLDQLAVYSKVLNMGGKLFLSGFYENDCGILFEQAEKLSLSLDSQKQSDNWASLKLIRR